MPKVFSSEFKQNALSLVGKQPILELIEITHPMLSQPVRYVKDSQDFIFQDNNFLAASWDLKLVTDEEKRYPEAKLTISNIGRMLTLFIEQSAGAIGAKCKIIIALRSNPSTAEFQVNFDMNNFSITPQQITCTLNKENVLNKPSQYITYSAEESVGLF